MCPNLGISHSYDWYVYYLFIYLFIYFVGCVAACEIFIAAAMWNLLPGARDQTQAPCIGSIES